MKYIYVLDYCSFEIIEIVIPEDKFNGIEEFEDEDIIVNTIEEKLGHTDYEWMVGSKQLNIIRDGKAM